MVALAGYALIAIGAFFTVAYSTNEIRCLCPTGSSCCDGFFAAHENQKIIWISVIGYGVMLLVLVWHTNRQNARPIVQ
jgi:hypothetical protein